MPRGRKATTSARRPAARSFPRMVPVRLAVALIGAGGAIIAAALISGVFSTPNEPAGRIASPTTSQRVARAFTADGTLAGIPRDKHVWLAVQIGNLVFPKEPEIPAADQHFAQQVVEAGSPPDGRFSLVLLMVDADGQRTIQEWLRRVRGGEDAPGLASIPGSVRLDVVRDLVLK